MKKIWKLLLGVGLLVQALPAPAQQAPVAVISLVWGQVTVKHENEDYEPARWLEPIFPGDLVKTSGPGSKLLVNYFSDNHQEVMAQDCEAQTGTAGLVIQTGSPVRRDGPRNPFGAGGVANPFIYTRKLVQADFPTTVPDIATENGILQARVRPTFPPSFFWQKLPAGAISTFQVYDYTGAPMWSKAFKTHEYAMETSRAEAMPKGVTYSWEVKSGEQEVVARYPFNLLTLPQYKWYKEQKASYEAKKASQKLQRSDWTDLLLVCAQLNYVDEALDLLTKMAAMDPQNPNIYRALTRVYLAKNCPAHAKQAHDRELQLGGLDPVYP